jgi:hypothetical protein
MLCADIAAVLTLRNIFRAVLIWRVHTLPLGPFSNDGDPERFRKGLRAVITLIVGRGFDLERTGPLIVSVK